MDPRPAIRLKKVISKCTAWSMDDVPPRWTVFVRTRKTPPGWEWRAASTEITSGHKFILYVHAHVRLDKWNAWLIVENEAGRSVLARLEQHGAAGEGIHMHANCCGRELVYGPDSIQGALNRLPSDPLAARRTKPWTRDSFWEYACRTLGIEHREMKRGLEPVQGELFE